MPLMVGDRNDVVNSTYGHGVRFTAGEKIAVPEILVKMCLDRGHKLAMHDEPVVAPNKTAPKAKPKSVPARRTRKPAATAE